MKDHHETDPQPETGGGEAKPSATIHSLDEWRQRILRSGSRRIGAGRRPRSGSGTGPARGRGGPGVGRGYPGYGGYNGSGRYGSYGGGGYGYGAGGYRYGGNAYGRGGGRGYGDTGRSGYGYAGYAGSAGRHGRGGSAGSSRVTPIHGGPYTAGQRRRRRLVMFLTAAGTIALLIFLLRGMHAGDIGPMVDPPAVLHVLVADGIQPDNDLAALLHDFETTHDVVIQWRSSPADDYTLYHHVLVGPPPDVILVDADTSARLLAMDALLEIAEETVRVRPTHAAIPREARNPELARRFLSHLSDITFRD